MVYDTSAKNFNLNVLESSFIRYSSKGIIAEISLAPIYPMIFYENFKVKSYGVSFEYSLNLESIKTCVIIYIWEIILFQTFQ